MGNLVPLVILATRLLALPPAAADVTWFGWLEGTWKGESAGTFVGERWWRVSESTLQGEGFRELPESGAREVTESLMITRMGDAVFYLARPVGAPRPVAFRLRTIVGSEAVFENREHDFPQVIRYRQNGDGTLATTVAGPGDAAGGQVRHELRLALVE